MPTVSDLLAIQLRIDTSGVSRGAEQATRDINRAANQIQQQASQLEHVVKNLGENIFSALHKVAGFFGIVLSVEGIRRLAETFATAGTALGRFSEAAGVSVSNVSALEQAMERAGGQAGDVRAVLQAMRSDITRGQMTGVAPEWTKTLGRAPFQFGIRELLAMSPDDILMRISQRAGAAHLTAAQLQQFLPGLPLSPESLAVLSNPKELQRLLSDVRRQQTALTPDQVKAAEALKEKFTTLDNLTASTLNDLVTLAEPILSRLLDWMISAMSWVDRFERVLLGEAPLPAPATAGAGAGFSGGASVAPPSSRFSPGPSPDSLMRRPSGGGGGVGDSGAVPSHILAQAEGVALQGGSKAVFDFMAAQGYPRSGNWCGEFAAAVIRSAGGTPPAGAAIASNWRKFGAPDDKPNPGDIAVRRGTPTGNTGSHVTIVESYDPSTRTFIGVGGNQRAGMRSKFRVDDYDFRKSIADDKASVKGSTFNDVSTASGRSAATTQGIALPSGGKMGDLYEITTPDGRKFIAPLIDRGPAAWTGRGVDISEELARKMGYDPKNFPTDSMFKVRPYTAPSSVPNVDTGAGASLNAPSPINKTFNKETSAVINSITVNTNATNAAGIAEDVKSEIGRQLSMPSN